MRENLKYILTLSIICFVTASLLTVVYLFTQPRIVMQKAQQQSQALKQVLPKAKIFEPVTEDGQVVYFRGYLSKDKQQVCGYAFKAQGQGYSSVIETMAGIDTQGRITGLKILAQNETPGLGAKINEVLIQQTLWQKIKDLFNSKKKKTAQQPKQPWFSAQFKGKKISDLIVVKTATKKNIQAITGATISSQALTDSIRQKAKTVLANEPH